MTREIKALETNYAGCRFRSRLEARWAVFFDALGIKWEYEKEGYKLPDGTCYLPDFWLPQVSMWAEVKPVEFTDEEVAKCAGLWKLTGHPVLMLDGLPRPTNFWAVEADCDPNTLEDLPEHGFMDYVIAEGSNYWIDEGRFFSCTGLSYPDREDQSHIDAGADAYTAARSARFGT